MHRLIRFELDKIWRKRSFLLSIFVLLVLNVFLLWYTNLPNEEEPQLSSYQAFQRKLAGMTEIEKADFVSGLKERIDGVCFVEEILIMQGMSGEMGSTLAEQAMRENPGVFETYYDLYLSGNYLKLTNSLQQEKALIDELYAEWQKVAGYNAYLQAVQENKGTLGGISIFGEQDENSFSARNIEKSAKDYAKLTDNNICWMPAKALTYAMESIWTDILLILSVFLFVGNLILEEKRKKLFYITRGTRYGIIHSIIGKLASLFIYSVGMSFLLYGTNLAFFGVTIGFGDITANIQSVASYMESSLSISILEYILFSVLTKGIVLFGVGAILTALCILANNILLPYMTGILLCGISYVLYLVIPAVGVGAEFKYLNLTGLLKTENLYGAYLNFNLFGYPISRLSLSWIVIILFAVIGVFASVLFFAYGENFELKNKRLKIFSHFKPHDGLLRHECYKIMITNRAAVIILLFGFLIGYRILSQQYNPSMQEQYYQNIMLRLEGELTEKKEDFILLEQNRYDEAFAKIEQIDRMVSEGKLDEASGESLKSEWYVVTAFYPSFERVLQQYQKIHESGGSFIYDTGYLYLFGRMNNDYLIDLLLLSLGVIFAFSNVIAMEYQGASWKLLGATLQGKRNIILRKGLVCVITAFVFSFIPFVCRIISITSVYPLHGLSFSVSNLPCCRQFARPVSVGVFLLLLILSQAMSLIAVTLVILALSCWRKNHIQTIFYAILILAVPLVLKLLGFSFAGWFSVYPIYSWPANVV